MKLTCRTHKGSSLVECAASMAVMLPLLMTILFVMMEMAQAYLIKEGLVQGAREAARGLAIAYNRNPSIAGNRTLADSSVLNNIRIQNIINASTQFNDPVWNTNQSPATVTVTVNYTSNKNGLPQFPAVDPLNLAANFALSAASTYRIE